MVRAIEAAVRIYEEPPTTGMTVTTAWSDGWLGADDWAEAFDAPEPGTPHNEAREQILDELVRILLDEHDERGADRAARTVVAAEQGAPRRRSTGRGRSWTRPISSATCGRCRRTCDGAPPG